MKLSQFASSLLVLSAVFCTLALSPSVRAARPAKVLIDFGDVRRDPDATGGVGAVIRVYDHAWNDWDKGAIVDMRRKGALIKARSSRGNLGENNTSVRFSNTPAVALDYVPGAGNKAKTINFKLVDDDGTEATWSVPLEGKAKQQLTTERLDLAKPTSIKGGKTPGLDLKHISSWEILGDWSDAPVEVLLVKMSTAE